MSSRTSKASFPPGFCALSWAPSPLLWVQWGFEACAGQAAGSGSVCGWCALARAAFSSSPGPWTLIQISRAGVKLILPALCVLLYLSVPLPGNPVVWLPCFVSAPASGTVGPGALLPLLMGSGASSWDPPRGSPCTLTIAALPVLRGAQNQLHCLCLSHCSIPGGHSILSSFTVEEKIPESSAAN